MAKKKPKANNRRSKTGHPILLVMKYMGSKKAIIDFVLGELIRLTDPGDVLVDIMAGTHTIGYAMKDRCKIIANDIQRYSRVIGETLLNYNHANRLKGEIEGVFRRYYLANMRILFDLFNAGLELEQKMFKQADDGIRWQKYRYFCEDYPYFMRPAPAGDWQEEFSLLFAKRRVEAYQTLNKLEPYSLFSLYYANSYLGVYQAAEIDSIRCAIDKLCDQWLPDHPELEIDAYGLRCLLLSALIAVMNKINPGPGHWAAFPRVSEKNFRYLIFQRRINVWDMFMIKVRELEDELEKHPSTYGPHISMTEDYPQFMEDVNEYIRQAKVVYLDPPYSQGHYSRFYHLVETLILYDYPEITHTGRYRIGRHQSPFAHKEKAGKAIGTICDIARKGGAILVISYSKGGIIKDDKAFRAILENHYPAKNISLKKLSSVHSKLGQAARMKTEEYLFTCTP